MDKIYYIDRISKKVLEEKVYGKNALEIFYGPSFLSKFILKIFSRLLPFFSVLYGWVQKSRITKRKIAPFIENYQIKHKEFQCQEFSCFNDFFIRKLRPDSRPIDPRENVITMPADGRYLVFPHIAKSDGFLVKGEKFSLQTLLQDEALAKRYEKGSMVIARLCPTDYHRFHFPIDCVPKKPRLLNGALFSVSPLALHRNINYLCENKRVITELRTAFSFPLLFIEIGATNVGSICQSFTPNKEVKKGDEKGYFSFGGSCIIMLFPPHVITFEEDLVKASRKKMEMYCMVGQSLGYIN